MSREFTRDSVTKFLPAQFPWIWCKCRLRILSDQIKTSSRKLFTAHYACSNSDLNLTPVTGTTNRFIFQIINSLIESWGVRLTCLDCKSSVHDVACLSFWNSWSTELSNQYIQSQSENKKQQFKHGQGASNINGSTTVYLWYLPPFITSLLYYGST